MEPVSLFQTVKLWRKRTSGSGLESKTKKTVYSQPSPRHPFLLDVLPPFYSIQSGFGTFLQGFSYFQLLHHIIVTDKLSICIHSTLSFSSQSQRSFVTFFLFYPLRILLVNKYIRRCADVYWPVRCILLCVVWYGQQSARVTGGTVYWGPQGYKAK